MKSTEAVPTDNAEAIEAWSGPLYDRFLRFEQAIDLVMSLGPAGEILRLQGDRAAHLHGEVHEALRAGLAEFEGPDGVRAHASTWIVTATAPGD